MDNSRLLSALKELIQNGPYINGKYLQNFEQSFSKYLNVNYTFGVSSGTAALDLALRVIKTVDNDEILMTAHAGGYGSVVSQRIGLTPVYFDINQDGSPNYKSFKERISIRTKGVILTNLYGIASDYSLFVEECRKNSIVLIEDCAQSIGARYPGTSLLSGSQADLATYSFYPTKNLSTIGDAGAICTNNLDYANKIRKLREYGWNTKYKAELAGGFNFRMEELHALILLEQLEFIETYNEIRRKLWSSYNKSLSNSRYYLLGSENLSFVAHLAVIKGPDIESFRAILEKNGIETMIHYPFADYDQPAFKKFKKDPLPFTDSHVRSVVSIPLYPELTETEAKHINKILSTFSKYE
jgi:aminotransferase EvaB